MSFEIPAFIADHALRRMKARVEGCSARAESASLYRRRHARPFKPHRVLRAEPVSGLIGLAALIEAIGVAPAVASAIGGCIVSSALSTGLSMASAKCPGTGI